MGSRSLLHVVYDLLLLRNKSVSCRVLDSVPKFRSEGPRSEPLCDRRGNCPLMDLFSERHTGGRDG